MIYHAHVPRVEDERAVVLADLHVLAGSLLLDEIVSPSAGLCALSSVGVPSGHIVGQKAPAGEGHAHGSVAERLDLHVGRYLAAQLPDVGEAHLSGEHRPSGSEVVERVRRGAVHDARLGGDVYIHIRGISAAHCHHAYICDYHPVRAGVSQQLYERRKLRYLGLIGDGVAGNVDPDRVRVSEPHCFSQLIVGEVSRRGSHPESSAGEIHRIGSVSHRSYQPVHIPRRRQHFQFSHRYLPLFSAS